MENAVSKAIRSVAQEIEYAGKAIKTSLELITWLNKNEEVLDALPHQDKLSFNLYWITWEGTYENPLTHETCIEIIKAVGGDWNKHPGWNGELFNYDRTEKLLDRSVHIESQPPPSCEIIEEEVVVPEHKEMKKRIVCKDAPEQGAQATNLQPTAN